MAATILRGKKLPDGVKLTSIKHPNRRGPKPKKKLRSTLGRAALETAEIEIRRFPLKRLSLGRRQKMANLRAAADEARKGIVRCEVIEPIDPLILIDDPVNHPKHYNSHPSGVECITVTRHMNFNVGNAIKYLWCAGSKGNTIQDLEKAAWYINDEIKRLKGETNGQ